MGEYEVVEPHISAVRLAELILSGEAKIEVLNGYAVRTVPAGCRVEYAIVDGKVCRVITPLKEAYKEVTHNGHGRASRSE